MSEPLLKPVTLEPGERYGKLTVSAARAAIAGCWFGPTTSSRVAAPRA
jgi:hypothetical protein